MSTTTTTTNFLSIPEVDALAQQHGSYHRTYLVKLGEDGHFYLVKLYRRFGDSFYQAPVTLAKSVKINPKEHAFIQQDIKFN